MMVEKVQSIYISLLEGFIPFVGKLSDKIKYGIITACFVADLILFCIVRYGLHKESYFYNTVFGIAIMLVITILSLDKKLSFVKWRRSMFFSWMFMCIAFTVSDIVVSKKCCGLGVLLAFLFPLLFFVWQNHSNKSRLYKCFKDAIKYSFWLAAVVSFLFRPLYEGGRYASIFTNPNTFSLYLFVIFVVFLTDLDDIVQKKRKLKSSIITFLSLALSVFYLSLTQTRTSFVTFGVVFLMWVVFRVVIGKKTKSFKPFLKNLIIVLVSIVVLYPAFLGMLKFIPGVVGHPIIFPGETLFLSNGTKIEDFGETVIAESVGVESTKVLSGDGQKSEKQSEEPMSESQKKELAPTNGLERFFYVLEHEKGLNALTNGRISIYQGYAKKLNYKGHKNVSLTINGKTKAHAHNNWLQFGYTYGIISMLFYSVITVLSVLFSIAFYRNNWKENSSFAFLIPGVCIGFVIATLAECLFLPFEVFPAFAYWFVLGETFLKKAYKQDYRHIKETNDVIG